MKGYVFDFDETLASSDITIGISRLFNGSPVEPLEWLRDIGIDQSSVVGFKRFANHNAVYLNSKLFDEYVEKTNQNVTLGELHRCVPCHERLYGLEDVIDYSHITRVKNPIPIEAIMEIGRRAFANGHIVGVVSARSSRESPSFDGTLVKSKCKEDIQAFLSRNGLPVQSEDIHCIGDLPGTIPNNKARTVLTEFIEKYNLDFVDFFDDSDANLLAVASLDNGSTRVDVHDSKNINGFNQFGWKLGSSIRRRSWRNNAKRARELSGLNES